MQALRATQVVRMGRGAWLGATFDGPGLQIGTGPAIPLPMAEVLRPGVDAALAGLRKQGITPCILSGDRQGAVQRIALQLGIEDMQAEVTAAEKYAYLVDLQASGHCVLMVGDGLNDTAALAAAHASVAPSSALDASRNAADVVLLRDSLADFPRLVLIARAAMRLSKQNFAIAAAYNAIAVPVALMGYATPLIAAIAMSLSSITVLANAMRVRRAA